MAPDRSIPPVIPKYQIFQTLNLTRIPNSVRWKRMTTIEGDAAVTILTYTTDEKARITLPKNFANSTVLVEQVSETELRIRKAGVNPEDDLPFVEEAMTPLSDRDRDAFLALLDNPPPPNDALRRLLTSGHDCGRSLAW